MVKNWKNFIKKYAGLWIALADDEETVIASGEKLADVLEVARKQGQESPIIARVPQELTTYVGSFGV